MAFLTTLGFSLPAPGSHFLIFHQVDVLPLHWDSSIKPQAFLHWRCPFHEWALTLGWIPVMSGLLPYVCMRTSCLLHANTQKEDGEKVIFVCAVCHSPYSFNSLICVFLFHFISIICCTPVTYCIIDVLEIRTLLILGFLVFVFKFYDIF